MPDETNHNMSHDINNTTHMNNNTTLSEMNLKGKKPKQNKKKVEDAVEDQPVNMEDYPTMKKGVLESIDDEKYFNKKQNGPHKRNLTTKGKVSDDKNSR